MRKPIIVCYFFTVLLVVTSCSNKESATTGNANGLINAITNQMVETSIEEVIGDVLLPENISLSIQSETITYPSIINLYSSICWTDFSAADTAVYSTLLGDNYKEAAEGRYVSEDAGTTKTLDLGMALNYAQNSDGGKGSDVLTSLVDYTSSLYDSIDAQKWNTTRNYYDEDAELDGLSRDQAADAMTAILNSLGIYDAVPVYTIALDAQSLQERLLDYLSAKKDYWGDDEYYDTAFSGWEDIVFSDEDACYFMIFSLVTDGVHTFTGNENTSGQSVLGVEIRCLYGKNGLISLYLNRIPNNLSEDNATQFQTITPQDAFRVFYEEYAKWQIFQSKIVSISLEYVVQQTVIDNYSVSYAYTPAWVICTEYSKAYPLADGTTVDYIFHDYIAIDASTGNIVNAVQ